MDNRLTLMQIGGLALYQPWKIVLSPLFLEGYNQYIQGPLNLKDIFDSALPLNFHSRQMGTVTLLSILVIYLKIILD